MRTFIAISLPAGIKAQLKTIQEELTKIPVQLKWVKPENLHITLKFLGDIEAESLGKVKEAILETAAKQAAFSLHLGGFGFFPNPRKPRVFFISSWPEKELENIAYSLEEKMQNSSLKERRKFTSHITLARIKDLSNTQQLKEKADSLCLKESSFQVERISLYKSTLTSQGPIYEEIFKSSLKN